MDWACDEARLSYQEADLKRIFKYKPEESIAIKIVKSTGVSPALESDDRG